MTKRTIGRTLACSLLMLRTAAWGADPPVAPALITPAPVPPSGTNALGPRIQFETPVHDFGRAKSGDLVKYSYSFTNTGDQTLQVSGVQACGCITADWTKSVDPGKMGSIPITFNSAGYMGPVIKAVTVTCNDKAHPQTSLQFKGTIWRPLDVTPQFALLNLTADSPLASATVHITNNLPEPITLSQPEGDNRLFKAELTTVQDGKEFQVTFSPLEALPPGSSRAQFTLKTSLSNAPVISIPVLANVQPAITIVPGQVVLPPAPLAQLHTVSLDVVVNTTNSIVLFEPRVNAEGIDIQMKEMVPGHKFTALLTFPKGFQVPHGQGVELSIKSSLTQMPIIRAPILQPTRPMPQPMQPAGVGIRPPSTSTNRSRPLRPIEFPPPPP